MLSRFSTIVLSSSLLVALAGCASAPGSSATSNSAGTSASTGARTPANAAHGEGSPTSQAAAAAALDVAHTAAPTSAGSHPATNTAPPTAAPTFTPTPIIHLGGSATKPALQGLLVNFWYPGASTNLNLIGGYVVGVTWSQLQPAANGPLNTTSIDYVLVRAKAQGLRIKLRITAGVQAPDWVKSLGGPPVAVTDSQSKTVGTVGRFWTDAYAQAYNNMEAALAAKYDGDPSVAEVVIDRCTTVFPEPFIRQVGTATVANLLAAGYTVAADELCQAQQIAANQVWHTTRSGLAFNPYESIAANGTASMDEAFTEQMMVYCHTTLGDRCVLENDSIRYPSLVWLYIPMYQHMAAIGTVSFQTAQPSIIGDILKTLQWARGAGAVSVEIALPMPATLAQMHAAFG